MSEEPLDSVGAWRAIILYGLNTATYKIALGQCLAAFARAGVTHVSMEMLATAFFDAYRDRLRSGKPQLDHPNRLTVMERVISQFDLGVLSREAAIAAVARDAFGDVVPRFHTLSGLELPARFYHHTAQGLVLTDSLFEVFGRPDQETLQAELGSRWDLLEAAFTMKRQPSELANDIRRIYLAAGYDRTDITENRPVLNGYQQGRCFYCGEAMHDEAVVVDHVIPRQVVQHDDIWNLVLAHAFCNAQKSDLLPGVDYVEKLIERNEHFIGSNHPIRPKLVAQLGTNPERRRRHIERVYGDARLVLGPAYTWEGIRGYHAATDPFYRSIIRKLKR
ncbi:MAG: hypothetical protein RLZZ387_80 [Chloroflexota bacterium]